MSPLANSVRLRSSWASLARSLVLLAFTGAFVAEPALASPSGGAGKATLRILHTNDMHSAFAGLNDHGTPADEQKNAVGGYARIAHAQKKAKERGGNVIVVDAGDQLVGSLFHSAFRRELQEKANARFACDAMTLGNHEFDEGCEPLAKSLENIAIPVVAANLAPGPGCPLYGRNLWQPYVVKDLEDMHVGIVGLSNEREVGFTKACPDTRFTDTATALQTAVRKLEAMSIRHVVVVSHLGLAKDRELARSVEGVDVIVSGHDHYHLGPDSEHGPYPIVERSPSGNPVLLVTAKYWAEYLGNLEVDFDAQGVPVAWRGQAVRLEADMPLDREMAALVDEAARGLQVFRQQIVGHQEISLSNGHDACRTGECPAGLITADAMLEFGRPHGATIALMNAGGLRACLPKGDISRGDVLAMLPFGNSHVLRDLKGRDLLNVLEHGASKDGGRGSWLLHPAGLRYVIDPSMPVGFRVTDVKTVDENGIATALDPDKTYRVIIPDFLGSGGDGQVIFSTAMGPNFRDGLDVDVVCGYLARHNPLPVPILGRIVHLDRDAR